MLIMRRLRSGWQELPGVGKSKGNELIDHAPNSIQAIQPAVSNRLGPCRARSFCDGRCGLRGCRRRECDLRGRHFHRLVATRAAASGPADCPLHYSGASCHVPCSTAEILSPSKGRHSVLGKQQEECQVLVSENWFGGLDFAVLLRRPRA